MMILKILIFVMGIANFAMHRAMFDSTHPMVVQARESLRRFWGPWGSYFLELAILIAALAFAEMEAGSILFVYGIYTLTNAGSLWLLRDGS